MPLPPQLVAKTIGANAPSSESSFKTISAMSRVAYVWPLLPRGDFDDYSVGRLMKMLTVFDQDIEIVMRPNRKAGKPGRITFDLMRRDGTGLSA
jgi:hypothetical protein